MSGELSSNDTAAQGGWSKSQMGHGLYAEALPTLKSVQLHVFTYDLGHVYI